MRRALTIFETSFQSDHSWVVAVRGNLTALLQASPLSPSTPDPHS